MSPEDSDDVVVALETARVQEERSEYAEAARWLQRAAVAARKQGRPERAGQLSRAAVSLNRDVPESDAKFERRPDEQQVLSEADEFQDETIVDLASKIRDTEEKTQKTVLAHGTPVAPLLETRSAPTYTAVRVAVRRALGGRFETRLLGEKDKLQFGEEEALLVPLAPSSKFS